MNKHINILKFAAVSAAVLLAAIPARAQGDETDKAIAAASVSTITAEELENVYHFNIAAALSGKLPGLIVLQSTGGSIEETPELYVRGQGSFNGSEPKVYVDGLQSSLSNLSVSEIESISVLKDAAALSIFGMEGADGIIWVKTKRGSVGKTKVDIKVSQGFQTASWIPDFVDSYTFASLYNEAMSNDAGVWTPYYSDTQLQLYRQGNTGTVADYDLLYPNVNWYDEVLMPFAPSTNAELSFSGGGDRVRFFAMAAYQGVSGLYANTDPHRDESSNMQDNKFNFRVNLDANISKVFDLKVNLASVIRNQYRPNSEISTVWTAMHTVPANAFPVMTPRGYGGNAYYNNPVAEVLGKGWFNNHTRVIEANFTLGQNLDFITKGLRLEESIAVYSLHQQKYLKSRTYQMFEPYLDPAGTGEVLYNTYGEAATTFDITNTGTSYNNMQTRIQEQVTLRYARTFGQHGVNAFVIFHNDKYSIPDQRLGLVTRGFLGRAAYDWNRKAYVSFDWSYMGKSVYNPDHNMGFFPSLSAAYVFFNDKDADSKVNYLKLRASTGLIGKADLSTASNYWMYEQYYASSSVGPKFDWTGTSGKKGMYESYMANPDAQWEVLHRTNVGIDASFFGNRLSFTVDAFYDNRTKILVSTNLPDYYGILSDKNINDGKVRNYGIEGSITWSDHIGDFWYTVTPVISFARNSIVNMNEEPANYMYQLQTGRAIGVEKRYVFDGFYNSEEEVAALPSLLGEVHPGDIRYKDLSGDGKIDENDMTYAGDFFSEIPELYGGININLGWKGFDFAISGYGMTRRQINTYSAQTRAFSNGRFNVSSLAEGRWAYWPEQGIDTRETATFPRLTLGSNTHNTAASTFWIKDGSFFRINNMALGYTIPEKWSSKIHIDKLRIYFSVVNPFVFDGVYGDAEFTTSYPLMRTYKIGLDLNF